MRFALTTTPMAYLRGMIRSGELDLDDPDVREMLRSGFARLDTPAGRKLWKVCRSRVLGTRRSSSGKPEGFDTAPLERVTLR